MVRELTGGERLIADRLLKARQKSEEVSKHQHCHCPWYGGLLSAVSSWRIGGTP
jgi:hypothetical protein